MEFTVRTLIDVYHLCDEHKLNLREHTILLSRKGVNKGMKRMNSIPLPPVVASFATLQGNPLPTFPTYVLHNTVELNSYLGHFALGKNIFG